MTKPTGVSNIARFPPLASGLRPVGVVGWTEVLVVEIPIVKQVRTGRGNVSGVAGSLY